MAQEKIQIGGKRKRWLRPKLWVAVTLMIFSVLTFVILITTLVVLPSQRFSQFLLRQINQRLCQNFSLAVEAEFLRFNIWRGRIEGENLKIWLARKNNLSEKEELTEEGRNSWPPLLAVKRVSFDLALGALIRGKLHFQEILIDSPLLHLQTFQRAAEKKVDLISLAQKSPARDKSRRLYPWRIDRLQLENGGLSLRDGPIISRIDLQGIKIEITFDDHQKQHLGMINLAKGQLAWPQVPIFNLTTSYVAFHLKENEIFFDRLLLQGEGLSLEGNGHLSLTPELFLQQAQLNGVIDLEKMPFFRWQFKGQEKGLKESFPQGWLNFSLNLSGKKEEISGHFQLAGKNIIISFPSPFMAEEKPTASLVMACPHLRGEIKGGLKEKAITLELAQFDLPALQFTSCGFYNGKNFKFEFALKASDLAQLLKATNLEDFILRKIASMTGKTSPSSEGWLAGQLEITGWLFGHWPEDKSRIALNWPELEGQIELWGKNLSSLWGDRGELALKAILKDRKINFTQAQFFSPFIEFSSKGFLSLASVNAALASQSDLIINLKIKDLGQLRKTPIFKFMDALGESKLKSLNKKGEVELWPLSGTLILDSRIRGDLKEPQSTFHLQAQDLTIATEKLASVELTGNFHQSVLTITNFELKKKESAWLKARLFYDLKRKRFQGQIEATPHELADFSWLQLFFPVQGTLGFNLEFAGENNKLYCSYRFNGNNIHSQIFSVPHLQAEGWLALKAGHVERGTWRLNLGPSGFRLYSLALETPEPIELTLSDEFLTISGLNLGERNFKLKLSGSLGINQEKGELQLETKFPLDLANRFLPPEFKDRIIARGDISITGRIAGSLADIKPDITLSLTDASLILDPIDLAVKNLNLLAKLNQEAFVLERLSFNLGQGSVLFQAHLPLKSVPPYPFSYFFNHLSSSSASNSVPSPNLMQPYLFTLNESLNAFFSSQCNSPEKIKNEEKIEEAKIKVLFSHLNPGDWLRLRLKNLSADYQEKIASGEIGGEISGEINASFWPSFKDWLSSLRGEGQIEPLKIKFEDFTLTNKGPIRFHFTSTLFTLEESVLEGKNFELQWHSEIKHFLNFRLPKKELSSVCSESQFSIGPQAENLTKAHSHPSPEALIKTSPEPYFDLAMKAAGDLEAFSPFFKNLNLGGKVALNLWLIGPLSSLQPRAFAELRSLSLQLIDWPLRLSDTTSTFYFDGQRLEIQSCRGLINGAIWEVTGFLELAEANDLSRFFKPRLSAGLVQIEAKNIPLFLEGLGSSEVSLALKLEPRKRLGIEAISWLLSGHIGLKKNRITADIAPLWRLTRPKPKMPRRGPIAAPPSLLQNLDLNVQLNLEEPLIIHNPFLRAEMQGALTVSGSALQPVLLGRFINVGPGELLWIERRYRLEKMEIVFTGTFPPIPQLTLLATTEFIHRYDELKVSLNLSGPVSDLRFQLQSTPPRSQEELALILLTGRSLEEIRTQGLGTLREQLLLSLATPTASRLGGAMKRLFGLEEVRLEPLGIAGETDPGARLTLIKQLTPAARITSSIDITNSQHQTWAVDYQLTKAMTLQALRLDNGSYGAGLRHSLSWGEDWILGEKKGSTLKAKELPRDERVISKIELRGNLVFAENLLRKKLAPLKPGKEFSSFLLDRQLRNLEAFYRKKGYRQVKIEPHVVSNDDSIKGERQEKNLRINWANLEEADKKGVTIILEIDAGPKIELTYEGASLSKDWQRQIEAIWAQEKSPEQAASRACRLIEKALKGQGYYQARVSFELKTLSTAKNSPLSNLDVEKRLKTAENQEIICHFLIQLGPRFRLGKIRISGVAREREKKLLQEIKSWRSDEAKGLWLLVVDSKMVAEAIKSWYESQGFLTAKASLEIEEKLEERLININLLINEGPLSRVGEIRVQGNEAIGAQEIMSLLHLREGDPFKPELIIIDRHNLLSLYRSRGFREAAIASSIEMMDDAEVRVIFEIKEGLPYKIGQIDFRGVKESRREKLIEIFGLKLGEPLNLEKISQGQRSLYETGDFSLVKVTTEPIANRPGEEKVEVEVHPEPAINFRYGLRYNTQEKTEFTVGLDWRHFLGFGRHGLLHYLHNARESDFRFSFQDRNFLGLKVDSLLSFYLTRRDDAGFRTDEAGASWRHQLALPGRILLSTVMRRSRIHTYETKPFGPWPFDISLSLTEIMLQAVRDTRDDPLDPRQGSFFSASLTYSPGALKSELTYFSWFGQASLYQPLSSQLTWASNLRLGLATAFDQVMVPARRFYAGGAYSLRGFKHNMVGPYDPYLKQPEGGEAVFISNQELRWRFFGGLEMAFFYDAGNVFPEVKDVSLRQLRHSFGLGLRLRSPIGLLRFEVGFNLRPKPPEARQVFFFSLGPIF